MAWGIRDYAGPSKIFWSGWYFHFYMSTQNLGESCKYFMGFIHFYLKNYFNKIWKSFFKSFLLAHTLDLQFQISDTLLIQRTERKKKTWTRLWQLSRRYNYGNFVLKTQEWLLVYRKILNASICMMDYLLR